MIAYKEMTLLFVSQMTLDQVQGLTWFGFQSESWLLDAFNEYLNAKSASPVKPEEFSDIQHLIKLAAVAQKIRPTTQTFRT